MSDRLQGFRRYLEDGALSAKTVEQYLRVVGNALKTHPKDLVAAATRPKLSPSTRQQYRAALKQWAEFMKDEALLEALDSRELRRTLRRMHKGQASDTMATQPFTDAEVDAILSVINRWERERLAGAAHPAWVWPGLRILIKLGLRAGVDLAGLERGAVGKALKDKVTLVLLTKGGKTRRVPAAPVLTELAILYRIPDWQTLADLISPSATNRMDAAYDVISTKLRLAAAKAGLDPREVHSHRFRHTAANRLYDATQDIMMVKELLGHSSVTTTQKYLQRTRTGQIADALK